jgi:hypothetical protein
MSHPSHLSREALNVVLLSLKNILRNKKRKRTVLDANLLDTHIEPLLNLLPDTI